MSSTDTELDDEKMDEVLKGYNIPTQPKVMLDVMDECRKKEPNLIRIADIISKDVGLASGGFQGSCRLKFKVMPPCPSL